MLRKINKNGYEIISMVTTLKKTNDKRNFFIGFITGFCAMTILYWLL